MSGSPVETRARVAYAAIANGGVVRTPRLGVRVVDPVSGLQEAVGTGASRRVAVRGDVMAYVRAALRAVVVSGTGAQAFAGLAADWPVTLFPEGTTGDGVTIAPFKASLLAALDPPPPGVRVQPVRIDYGAATAELAWVGDEHGKDHAIRVLKRNGTFRPTLHFCEPFAPEDYGSRKAVAAEARRRIEATASPRTV